MIKLNLLPRYLIEIQRLKVMSIVFGILLALIAGVTLKARADYKAQAEWYASDMKYYTNYKKDIDAAKADADAKGKLAQVYPKYNTFFSRVEAQQHADAIAKSIAEAANAVSGQKAWYKQMRIEKDKVTLDGEMVGLMEFVNYYFHLKGNNFEVDPGAQPYPTPRAQVIALRVRGTIATPLPAIPDVPNAGEGQKPLADWSDLYTSVEEKNAASNPAASGQGAYFRAGGGR